MDRFLKKYIKKLDPVRKQIREIWLFGSRARGDYDVNSDYDLLILVKKRNRKILDAVYTAASDLLLEDIVDISAKVYPIDVYQKFVAMRTPFTMNIKHEGIRLG